METCLFRKFLSLQFAINEHFWTELYPECNSPRGVDNCHPECEQPILRPLRVLNVFLHLYEIVCV